MDGLIMLALSNGWTPAAVACAVFFCGLAVGLTMAAVIGGLVRWIFERVFSSSQ